MAKAAFHFPVSSGQVPGHDTFQCSDSRRRSPEQLGAHLRESLARILLPSLCRPCKEALLAPKGSSQSKLEGSGRPSRGYLVARPIAASHFSIESICNKCKASMLSSLPFKETNKHRSKKQPIRMPSAHPSPTIEAETPLSARATGSGASGYVVDMLKSLFSRFYSTAATNGPKALQGESPRTEAIRQPGPCSSTLQLDFYARCIKEGKPWCRFCGAAGSSCARWFGGPWGPQTLCYRHSPFYKGPEAINLDCFLHERQIRTHPVVKDYCRKCWVRLDVRSSCLRCFGCPFSYHVGCIPATARAADGHWFCHGLCRHGLDALEAQVVLPYQALMPFCDVEVVSDTDGVSPSILVRNALCRKRAPEGDDECKENGSSPKRKAGPARATSAPPNLPLAEIPVPGITRHSVPAFIRLKRPSAQQAANDAERLDDLVYLDRHKRYENTEMQSRICRPQVLKKLMANRDRL